MYIYVYICIYIYIYNIYTSSHIYVFCQIYYCNNFQFSKSAFLVISKPITYRLISFHRNTNYGRSKGSAIIKPRDKVISCLYAIEQYPI